MQGGFLVHCVYTTFSPPSPPSLGGTGIQSPPELGDLGGFHRLVYTRHLAPLAPQNWGEPEFKAPKFGGNRSSRVPQYWGLGGFHRLVYTRYFRKTIALVY